MVQADELSAELHDLVKILLDLHEDILLAKRADLSHAVDRFIYSVLTERTV